MADERSWWQALALAEAVVTTACGLATVAFYTRQYHRASSPGRRLSALALMLTGLGVVAGNGGGQRADVLALAAGLPACAGQVLIALLIVRQLVGRN
ncbi:MAG: hypothetical protein U0531_04950 [Dehalococcoidia bacterium]